MFQNVFPYKKATCQKLFMTFSKNSKTLNIFEMLSVMIISGYANFDDKLRLIFSLFDLDASNAIDL